MKTHHGYYFWFLSLYTIIVSLWLRIFPSNYVGVIAILCFSAVMTSAMLISWAAEAAEFSISQGLAVAIVALLQVVPEFMVEAVIAWHKDIDLMMANVTGSNRLLMGVGWPMIFMTTDLYSRGRFKKWASPIKLRPENIVEVGALFIASLYFVVVILKKTLQIYDGIFLGIIYLTPFACLRYGDSCATGRRQ